VNAIYSPEIIKRKQKTKSSFVAYNPHPKIDPEDENRGKEKG